MTKIIARELSYDVNGCIFDVHNEVGPGVREECYQEAMEIRFTEREAIYDDITTRAVRTMQTHLQLTDCSIGLVACFGKTHFLIRGVRP